MAKRTKTAKPSTRQPNSEIWMGVAEETPGARQTEAKLGTWLDQQRQTDSTDAATERQADQTTDTVDINYTSPAYFTDIPAPGTETDDVGNVFATTNGAGAEQVADGLPPAHARPGESRSRAWERIRREGRAAGLGKREAYERANVEADRLFPVVSPQESEPIPEPPAPELPPIVPADAPGDSLGGLADLPDDWPTLPDNAALGVEVQWVQANRLLVRQGEAVDLSRARTPAPSHAALSWLETSLLFPAKWADITAKATQGQEDEREHARRERLDLQAAQGLLIEMTT